MQDSTTEQLLQPSEPGTGRESSPRLTVLLTLLGRHEFTPRWFAHAARELAGCRVLVADGSHDSRAELLVRAAQEAHPEIEIAYRRHTPDVSVADYQRKLGEAIASITTPYTMLADNDDFHVGEGVRRAMAMLDANPALVTARGRVAHLVVRSPVQGRAFPIHARRAVAFDYEFSQPIDAPTAAERLRAHGRKYAPSWYAVMRTPLAQAWSGELARRPMADLGLIEWLQASICCARGPQAVESWPFLFRQYNVTTKSSQAALSRGDQIDATLADGWSLEAKHCIDLVSSLVAASDGMQQDLARTCVHGALHDYLETRVLRQGISRRARRPAGARWLASVATGRLAQRWIAGSWFGLLGAVGLRAGPARGVDRVLPALRGECKMTAAPEADEPAARASGTGGAAGSAGRAAGSAGRAPVPPPHS